MSLIKTLTQPLWALVRLLPCFSIDLQYLSCVRGGVGISIHLRVPGWDGGVVNALAVDTSKQEFRGTNTNVLSANCPCQCVFDLAARAAGGRHYVLCDTAEYLRC